MNNKGKTPFFMRRMGSKGGFPGADILSMGRSRAKLYTDSGKRVTFHDVAGVDEAKELARRMVKEYGMSEKLGLVVLEGERRSLLVDASFAGDPL
ncbi:MAG: hypothetical protein ACUVXI_02035 [bacterium]